MDVEEIIQHNLLKCGIELPTSEVKAAIKQLMLGSEEINITEFISLIQQEIDRHQWLICSKIFKRAVEAATILGADIENILSSYDADGSHRVSLENFDSFLIDLSKYYLIEEWDRRFLVKYFSKLSDYQINLKQVCSYLNIEYIGNLKVLLKESIDANSAILSTKLSDLIQNGIDFDKQLSFESLFTIISNELQLFEKYSKENVMKVIRLADKNKDNQLSLRELFQYFNADSMLKRDVLDAEGLLRLLFNKAHKLGLSVDDTFRHFDADGEGRISIEKLQKGLADLRIFEGIKDWEKQLPKIASKFDESGSGLVSLKELYRYLGANDYIPNIIQIVTRVFALAYYEKGLSMEDIFSEFDADSDGKLKKSDINTGLTKLHFNDVSEEDIQRIYDNFNHDDEGSILVNEFVAFFKSRIQQLFDDRAKLKFLKAAKSLNSKESFSNILFDKSDVNVLTRAQFFQSFRSTPYFSALTDGDAASIFSQIDTINTGSISKQQLEYFINPNFGNSGSIDGSRSKYESKLRDEETKLDNAYRDCQSESKLQEVVEFNSNSLLDKIGAGNFSDYIDDYPFSRDPEIRLVEKKLRCIGKTLLNQGVDFLASFKSYDTDNTGSIRRTDFIDLLSKYGIKIINSINLRENIPDIRKDQINQIRKLKGIMSKSLLFDNFHYQEVHDMESTIMKVHLLSLNFNMK